MNKLNQIELEERKKLSEINANLTSYGMSLKIL